MKSRSRFFVINSLKYFRISTRGSYLSQIPNFCALDHYCFHMVPPFLPEFHWFGWYKDIMVSLINVWPQLWRRWVVPFRIIPLGSTPLYLTLLLYPCDTATIITPYMLDTLMTSWHNPAMHLHRFHPVFSPALIPIWFHPMSIQYCIRIQLLNILDHYHYQVGSYALTLEALVLWTVLYFHPIYLIWRPVWHLMWW